MLTRRYRTISLILAMCFAAVGLCFLLIPGGVLGFFNRLGTQMGMPPAPNPGMNFFVALSAAYMYLVTLLAVMMWANPAQSTYALLLTHAKAASALVSLGLFLFWGPHFILLANALVDGMLAGLSAALHRWSLRSIT